MKVCELQFQELFTFVDEKEGKAPTHLYVFEGNEVVKVVGEETRHILASKVRQIAFWTKSADDVRSTEYWRAQEGRKEVQKCNPNKPVKPLQSHTTE